MADARVQKMNPETLRNHPLNPTLYGDVADDALVESMQERGQLEAITLAADAETVVSGHRRLQAARKLKWKTIDAVVKPLKDRIDIALAVIDANEQRPKTKEQRAREYTERKRLFAQKAAQEKLKPPKKRRKGKGRSGSRAAESAGMGVTAANQAEDVVKMIDEMEAEGDTEAADHLRKLLETKSVAAAHQAAAGNGKAEPDVPTTASGQAVPVTLEKPFDTAAKMKSLRVQIGRLQGELKKLAAEPGGDLLNMTIIAADLANVKRAIKDSTPHELCPRCKGKGCKTERRGPVPFCQSLGWMSESQWRGIPPDNRP